MGLLIIIIIIIVMIIIILVILLLFIVLNPNEFSRLFVSRVGTILPQVDR